jgi:hypothetical protein
MALGYTTYKTPNAIFLIGSDLTGKEGCGVTMPLGAQGKVDVAAGTTDTPYGIVTVGGPSEDGTYPGLIGGSSVEFVDMLGCTVQVQVSSSSSIAAGEFVLIDSAEQDGTFTGTSSQSPAAGDWVWGLALTNAAAGEQCLMRFQPFVVQYIAP